MDIKKLHYFSGLIITIFISLHLFNHVYSVFGAEKHIEMMMILRHFYRHIFIESILILAVCLQILSGIKLFAAKRKTVTNFFEKLQIWSGLYLALFFVIHLSAVFAGRIFLKLDTNFYFGVAGLNSFPTNLFFIPYYVLAIFSFFGHIAAIHNSKMKHSILGVSPTAQSFLILVIGLCITIVIFFGLTNQFRGVEIPTAYNVLIGK
jgi:hypothetical protein